LVVVVQLCVMVVVVVCVMLVVVVQLCVMVVVVVCVMLVVVVMLIPVVYNSSHPHTADTTTTDTTTTTAAAAAGRVSSTDCHDLRDAVIHQPCIRPVELSVYMHRCYWTFDTIPLDSSTQAHDTPSLVSDVSHEAKLWTVTLPVDVNKSHDTHSQWTVSPLYAKPVIHKHIKDVTHRAKLRLSSTNISEQKYANVTGAKTHYWTSEESPPKSLYRLAVERGARSCSEQSMSEVKQRVALLLGKSTLQSCMLRLARPLLRSALLCCACVFFPDRYEQLHLCYVDQCYIVVMFSAALSFRLFHVVVSQ